MQTHTHTHTLNKFNTEQILLATSHFALLCHTNEIFLTLLIAYPEHAAGMLTVEKRLSD